LCQNLECTFRTVAEKYTRELGNHYGRSQRGLILGCNWGKRDHPLAKWPGRKKKREGEVRLEILVYQNHGRASPIKVRILGLNKRCLDEPSNGRVINQKPRGSQGGRPFSFRMETGKSSWIKPEKKPGLGESREKG